VRRGRGGHINGSPYSPNCRSRLSSRRSTSSASVKAYPRTRSSLTKSSWAQASCTNARWFPAFFSHRTCSLRERFSQRWFASTTHRRALPSGCGIIRSSPRGRTCVTYPRACVAVATGSPAYPASRHRCCPPSGHAITTAPSVSGSNTQSLRFAPATVTASSILAQSVGARIASVSCTWA